ncbi:MAG: CinA family protein [Candidatus Nitrotoga sp.]|nr:CinA family protein [Candidatus Nitrotoga sp.]
MTIDHDIAILAAEVGASLKRHGYLLSTAESCTGGAVANAITDIPGSSEWFDCGFITYSSESKREILGVTQDSLVSHGAVSEVVVRQMVTGALRHSRSGVALAVSGIAGPTGATSGKPIGTVWLAWGIKGGSPIACLHYLHGDRTEIRKRSTLLALQGILDLLDGATKTA